MPIRPHRKLNRPIGESQPKGLRTVLLAVAILTLTAVFGGPFSSSAVLAQKALPADRVATVNGGNDAIKSNNR